MVLPSRRAARLSQNASRCLSTDPLKSRQHITQALGFSPYDPDLWHQRAVAHIKLGYPDLAIGDAYRALLLVQELLEAHEESEFGFLGLEAWRERRAAGDTYATGGPEEEITNGVEKLKVGGDANGVSGEHQGDDEEDEEGEEEVPELTEQEKTDLTATELASRKIIARSLLEIGCLLDAWEQIWQTMKLYPDDVEVLDIHDAVSSKLEEARNGPEKLSDYQLREGQVARVIYPWNTYEPDRTSDETVAHLNTFVSAASKGNFEVKVTELPMLIPDTTANAAGEQKMITATSRQLGVYATKDLTTETEVFSERSIFTVNNRLLDPLCDCCNGPLGSNPVECPDCDDVAFCSPECSEEAQEKYHPSLCGFDIDFLFKSSHDNRNPSSNDSSETSSSSSPTKSLYSLLLLRTLAMALTQKVNPLELLPIKYLYGSSPPPPPPQSPPTLPFTFSDNILSVFHILTRLEVDPFKVSLHTFDIWHTLTIHSKILGTASARHSKVSGQPEIAALHLCYSLVNHDCEPCLAWECASEMKFRTLREIKKGEEVRDCYTDPRIEDWRKRREWLMGSLGGGCRCGRCLRESEADP